MQKLLTLLNKGMPDAAGLLVGSNPVMVLQSKKWERRELPVLDQVVRRGEVGRG
jgi:hypothetical protein